MTCCFVKHVKPLSLIVFCLCTLGIFKSFGQNITYADGSPFATTYCFFDSSYQIIGTPAGGTFSGCGVTNQGGNWYFNPATVSPTGSTVQCSLIYTPLAGPTVQKFVTVYSFIALDIDTHFNSLDTVTCDGDITLIYSYGGNPTGADYEFTWAPASASFVDASGVGTNNKVTGHITSTTVVTLTAKDKSNGCVDSVSKTMYYKPIDAKIVFNKDTVCALDPLLISVVVTPEAATSYAWQTDNATAITPTFTHAYAARGSYPVALIVGNGFCFDTTDETAHVADLNMEVAASKMIISWQEPVTLTTTGDVPYTVYSWAPANIFANQGLTTQTVTLDTTTHIYVYGASSLGCKDSADIVVQVQATASLPTAFTPNADGRNDMFHFVLSPGTIQINYIHVFDRWGKEVWSAEGANAIKGWDGTVNGNPAGIGVYYYQYEYVKSDGTIVTNKGDVTLLR